MRAPADQPAGILHSTGQSRYWKNLLHYRAGLFSLTEASETDEPAFFLNPQGRKDPEAELKSDLAAFANPDLRLGNLKQHPQCVFPERFRYLNETLGLKIKKEPCPDLELWRRNFSAQSVTLVYAAPFLGSPASMFGHTFLRIDSLPRPGHEKKNDLLDYAISFEAKATGDGAIGYAIKGLIGSYAGWFSQSPFYLKVNSYIAVENRDLWEYTIPLSPSELNHLLNHIWELGPTPFNYFFFNRNCSYQLLTLLEIAKPQWELHRQFSVMAIPSDTLRAVVTAAGPEVKRTYRPSLLQILRTRLRHMTSEERDQFFAAKDSPENISGRESTKTLDALLDWNQIVTMRKAESLFDPDKNVDQKLLLARAKLGVTTDETPMPSSTAPEEGHKTSKLALAFGFERNRSLLNLEFRPVFHDLMDRDEGYLPLSTLTIARLRASFFPSDSDSVSRVRLDDFTFAEVATLSPWSRLEKPLSWSIGGGVYHPLDLGCLDCLAGRAYGSGGFGFSFLPTLMPNLGYLLAKFETDVSNSFTANYLNNFRLVPALEIGAILHLAPNLKLQVKDEPTWAFSNPTRDLVNWNTLTETLALSSTLGELRFSAEQWNGTTVTFNRFLLAVGTYY